MPVTSKSWLSVLLCLVVTPQLVTALTRFRSWFPRYERALNYVVDHNCSAEYAAYLSDIPLPVDELPNLRVWERDQNDETTALINCILTAAPEIVKANFASAAVLLGLMPSVLAIIGPSTRETSTLLTVGDHPLLAIILCVGSPMVGLDRELPIRGSFRALKPGAVKLGLQRSLWIRAFQYLVALAAIANIAEVVWELSLKASYSWFQGDAFLLGVWAFVGFVIHLLGALALSTIIRVGHYAEMTSSSTVLGISRWLRWRFSFKRRTNAVRVVLRPPPFAYFLLTAFTTLLTLTQIMLGTIIFSSILFIGVRDAVIVFFRFMASVIACRILVLMELTFVQDAVYMDESEELFKIATNSSRIQKAEGSPEVISEM